MEVIKKEISCKTRGSIFSLTIPMPYAKIITDMPEWRNGRRTRLKIWRWQHRMGSSPISGTNVKSTDSRLLSVFFRFMKFTAYE